MLRIKGGQIPCSGFGVNFAHEKSRFLRLLFNGEGGIRTPGTGICPYDGLANRYLQPLGHLSECKTEVYILLVLIARVSMSESLFFYKKSKKVCKISKFACFCVQLYQLSVLKGDAGSFSMLQRFGIACWFHPNLTASGALIFSL